MIQIIILTLCGKIIFKKKLSDFEKIHKLNLKNSDFHINSENFPGGCELQFYTCDMITNPSEAVHQKRRLSQISVNFPEATFL